MKLDVINLRRILCIHHNDLDGYCSGHVINKKYQNVEFLEMSYEKEYDLDYITTFGTVIIVDFSFPNDIMQKINESSQLIWIDHHISAINDNKKQKLEGLQKDGTAACQLTWEYCYPNQKIPPYIKLLGDYDIWKNGTPEWEKKILPFQYYALSMKDELQPDSKTWETLPKNEKDTQETYKIGKSIQRYQTNQNTEKCEQFAFLTEIEEYKAIVLNTSNSNSQCFDSVPPKDYQIMCIYRWDGETYTFSLYSTQNNINCATICKKFGGGGHKGAAGFSSKKLPWGKTTKWKEKHNGSI